MVIRTGQSTTTTSSMQVGIQIVFKGSPNSLAMNAKKLYFITISLS